MSIREYREHDGFVQFLSKDYGLLNFVLPGYYRAKSKQGRLGIGFSKVQYQFNYRPQSLNRIIGGQLVDGYFDLREDYDWLVDLSLASEIVVRMYQEEHHDFYYHSFESLIRSSNRLESLSKLLMQVLHYHGFSPYLEACVLCDNSGINSFSIKEGGFLCKNHSKRKDDKETLMVLYSLHLGKALEATEETSIKVIEYLVNYLSHHAEIKITSWKMKSGV